MDKYGYLPEVIANHPIVIDALLDRNDPGRIRQANVFLQDLNASAQSLLIYIMDAQGLTIAASNWQAPDSLVGNRYAFRPYFIDAMKTGSGGFYGMGATTVVPGYYLSRVIRKDDVILGVAAIKIDMRHIEESWKKLYFKMAVTDENGIIFLGSEPDWIYRPIRALTPEAQAKVRQTRQYEGVLKETLAYQETRRLGGDESIVDMSDARRGGKPRSYLFRASRLGDTAWTLNVFMPLDEVRTAALRDGGITASVLAFLLLAFIYVIEIRERIREREKSRAELTRSHEELQQRNEELRIASITDPLTGAYNRRFFFESALKLVSSASRHHHALSIVMVDVDHFKRINDNYGHPAGDKVLQVVAAIYKEELREEDIFARMGGEEFILALNNTDAEAARAVAERLRVKVMSRHIEIEDRLIAVTVSSGIAQYHAKEDTDLEATVKKADQALYEAKNRGRNQVVIL